MRNSVYLFVTFSFSFFSTDEDQDVLGKMYMTVVKRNIAIAWTFPKLSVMTFSLLFLLLLLFQSA